MAVWSGILKEGLIGGGIISWDELPIEYSSLTNSLIGSPSSKADSLCQRMHGWLSKYYSPWRWSTCSSSPFPGVNLSSFWGAEDNGLAWQVIYRLLLVWGWILTFFLYYLLGNSPDLNAIEAAWPWLKRQTTSRGAPWHKKTGKQAWIDGWNELPQENIQQWIEWLVRHIQEVIEHERGNEYKEGTTGRDNREWKGKRIKGELSRRQDLGDGPLF